MIETAPTLGSVETSTRHKRQLAKQSLDYNMRDQTFRQLFPEYVARHEQEMKNRPEGSAPKATLDSGAGATRRNNDGLEIDGVMATAAALFAIFSIVLAMRFF